MNTLFPILDRQLDLLDTQTSQEPWKNEQDLALLRGEVEDLISLALETLECIRRHTARLNRIASAEEKAQLVSYWARWHDIGLRALPCLDAIESGGLGLARANEFRFAVNEAGIVAEGERVMKAQERLDAGEGRSLEEIENELSRHPG